MRACSRRGQSRRAREAAHPGATRTLLVYCHFDTKPAPAARVAPAFAVRARSPSRDWPRTVRRIVTAGEVADDAAARAPALRARRVGRQGPDLGAPRSARADGRPRHRPAGEPEARARRRGGDRKPGFGDFVERASRAPRGGPRPGDGRAQGRERAAPRSCSARRGSSRSPLELEVARRDVHSGNFSVPNPAWILTGLLASMAAPDGTPLIEGLGADATPPTAAERELMAPHPAGPAGPRARARRAAARRLPRAR